MEGKVVLYSTGCPKCRLLKNRLDENSVEYEVCDDVDEMLKLGIRTVPVLRTENGTMLDFFEAMKFYKKA